MSFEQTTAPLKRHTYAIHFYVVNYKSRLLPFLRVLMEKVIQIYTKMLIFFLGLLKILAQKSHNSNTKNNSFGTVSVLKLTAGNPGALLG